MNYLDLCKREGWEGTCGRIANALSMLQSCTRLQSAAGTGKCADHQTLERSFWSVLRGCRRQTIQPSPSSVSCMLCRGNKLPGWLQRGICWIALISHHLPREAEILGTSSNPNLNVSKFLKFCRPLLFLCGCRSERQTEQRKHMVCLNKGQSHCSRRSRTVLLCNEQWNTVRSRSQRVPLGRWKHYPSIAIPIFSESMDKHIQIEQIDNIQVVGIF